MNVARTATAPGTPLSNRPVGSRAALPAKPASKAPWRASWWAVGAAIVAAYAGLFFYFLTQGAPAEGADSAGEWAWMALLHLPYIGIMLLFVFGLIERVGFFWRGRAPHVAGRLPAVVPKVCIQLPMFNEDAVARRVIEAAAALRWPTDRLIVQVLDDSTDAATRAHVQSVCADVRERTGVDCQWIHRTNRSGYKAGALEKGRHDTDAEFIAIFDADFVPPPDYLERALPHFYNAHGEPIRDRALVQAQWGHLNDDESWLTGSQSLWVDDHHSLQMAWRSANIDFVNFTGTAGVWRASAIEAAGGWRAASLVEDCELSIRVLFAGYSTRFVRQLAVPAELPQTLAAYRLQQKRWTQGWVQLQRLHLAKLLTTYPTSLPRKAFLLYLMCIGWQWPLWTIWVAMLPLLIASGLWLGAFGAGVAVAAYLLPPLLFAVFACAVATANTTHGQGSHKGSFLRRCARIVPYLVINTGMVPHHFCAFIEGLFGPMHAEFERTPKTASVTAGVTAGTAAPAAASVAAPAAAQPSASSTAPTKPRGPTPKHAYLAVEAAFCAAQAAWIVFFISHGMGLAVVGAVWVLACVGGLRVAPALRALFQQRQNKLASA